MENFNKCDIYMAGYRLLQLKMQGAIRYKLEIAVVF